MKLNTSLFYILIVLLYGLLSCSQGNTSENSNEVETGAAALSLETEELSDGVLINVKTGGFTGGTVKLLGMLGQNHYIADSSEADANGNVTFKREANHLPGMYYVFYPNNKYFQILLDRDQQMDFETEMNDFISTMKVTGSLNNELLYQNLQYEGPYRTKYDSLQQVMDGLPEGDLSLAHLKHVQEDLVASRDKHIASFEENYPNAFFTKFKMAGQNPKLRYPKGPNGELDTDKQIYLYRIDFWESVDFTDARMLRTPVYHNKLKRYMQELTPRNVDSLISSADYISRKSMANDELFNYTVNWIGLTYREADVMGGEAVFVHIIDNYFTHELAYWSDSAEIEGLRKEAKDLKPSLLGKIGADLRCKDIEGNYKELYGNNANLTVLLMWSHECDNCRKEMPELKRIFTEWKNKGIDIYALNIEKDLDGWKKFVTEENLPWTNVADPNYESRYPNKYHVDITPEIYVMNAEHKIIGKNLKAHQLPEVFQFELNKKKDN